MKGSCSGAPCGAIVNCCVGQQNHIPKGCLVTRDRGSACGLLACMMTSYTLSSISGAFSPFLGLTWLYITLTLQKEQRPVGAATGRAHMLRGNNRAAACPCPVSPTIQAAPAHVSLKLFSVFLCRLDTAMRAASCKTATWEHCRAESTRLGQDDDHLGRAGGGGGLLPTRLAQQCTQHPSPSAGFQPSLPRLTSA